MYSTRQIYIFSVVMALMIIGIGSFSASGTFAQQDKPKPFSGLVIDPETAKPFKLTAKVMEVNTKPSPHLVVGEKMILVTEYKLDNEINQTEMLNNYGQTITIEEIKPEERVIVHGLELTNGTLVGKRIQVKTKKR